MNIFFVNTVNICCLTEEQRRGDVRLHYLVSTDRVTSPFGNEQRRGEAVFIVYYHADRDTSPLFGNEQRRGAVRLYYLPRRCSEMNKGEVRSVRSALYTIYRPSHLALVPAK